MMKKYKKYLDKLLDIDYSNLTIDLATREINKMSNDLLIFMGDRDILFQMTQPQSFKYDKEPIKGGKKNNPIEKYVENLEEIEQVISILNERITNLSKWVENELKIMGEYEPLKAKIVSLRDKGMKWDNISKATNYSRIQCIRIYNKHTQTR